MRVFVFELRNLRFHLSLLLITFLTSSSQSDLAFPSPNISRKLLLVSTLDGHFSALNIADGGRLEWVIATQPVMLSSNIHKRELSENSQWVRMIPSLNGSLYKFNGENLQPVTNADVLLKSSYKFSDDVVISGGKERRTYGINVNNGRVLYECTMEKSCDNYSKSTDEPSKGIIVLQRHTNTVRALDPRYGIERWNFSVGHHEVEFLPSVELRNDLHQSFDGNAYILDNSADVKIRVVMPDGLVYATGKSHHQTVWKHKFRAPVVNAWRLTGDDLEELDLLSPDGNGVAIVERPVLYIGMHNKQLYIQESVSLQKQLEHKHNINKRRLANAETEIMRLPWLPVPVTENIVEQNKESKALQLVGDDVSTSALSVLYASEYVNGNGYYLYEVEWQNKSDSKKCDAGVENYTPIPFLIASDVDSSNRESTNFIWFPITASIVFCTTIAYFYLSRLRRSTPRKKEHSITTSTVDSGIVVDDNSVNDSAYVSRYMADFVELDCLGKGGFGVVFEAKNKIDDRQYAVKRITLPNSDDAKEKVLREVKALAILDHRNIVRYFNAWVENTPPNWKPDKDNTWIEYLTSDSVSKHGEYVIERYVNERHTSEDFSCGDNSLRNPYCATSDDSYIQFESDANSQPCEESKNSDIKKERQFVTSVQNDKKWLFLYIQMELCQRSSLKDWLQCHHDRELAKVFEIFRQLVSAVDYFHKEGLIHRDLKPSNIFFGQDGQIKVGDFGLATAIVKQNEIHSDLLLTWHSYTADVGTGLYMSPEQLNGKPYGQSVDIYAMGVIFFELLVPFNTVMERYNTLNNLRKGSFPEAFASDHKLELKLVEKMLSKNPAKRPTASDVLSTHLIPTTT